MKETDTGKRQTFIGVAWPYVNGELHIGHGAGYLLPADIKARYHRSIGDDVLMVSGSDCYGTPITIEADKEGAPPQVIADRYHKRDVHLFRDILHLSYDLYTRTDTEQHIKVVQNFFLKFLENGYIFVDTTQQFYSPKEGRFLPDRYVIGTCTHCGFTDARSDQCDKCGKLLEQSELLNPKSKLSSSEVSLKDTEHYFVDWPKLQPRIEEYVNKNGPNWKNWVFQETLGWLKGGLKARAITRDIDWGVPLPVDRIPKDMLIENIDHKRIYVWFDAVIGYLSASMLWSENGGGDWKDYWYNPNSKHFYFMGKDNLAFHTMFWPGQEMIYDPRLHLPDISSINMFLDYDGRQFSKSRGVSITIEDMVSRFGDDAVRFYLTLIMPETKDSSFRWQDFADKNNQLLVANLGNFIHRTLSIAQSADPEKVVVEEISPVLKKQIELAFKHSREALEDCRFRDYLDSMLSLSGFGNKYFDYEKVWLLKKENPDKFHATLTQLYSLIISLGYLFSPLLPHASENLASMLEIPPFDKWPEAGKEIDQVKERLLLIKRLNKPVPLFKKIDISEISDLLPTGPKD